MKVTWEAGDIKPGRIAGRVEKGERFMIGYDPLVRDDRRITLNSLSDGQITQRGNTEQIANALNACRLIPAELLP